MPSMFIVGGVKTRMIIIQMDEKEILKVQWL